MVANGTADFLYGSTVTTTLLYTTAIDINWYDNPSLAQICGSFDYLLGSKVESIF